MSTLAAISLPEFFIGYFLILFFSIKLGWLPSLSQIYDGQSIGDKIAAVILPAMTLVLVVLAHMMRMTRAAVISVMSAPYIEMAKLKGATPLRVIFRHAFPNAIAPIINVIVVNLAYLVVGVVVVEVIFVYPGMGQLMVDHVAKRDVPVVQACGLIFAATYILLNFNGGFNRHHCQSATALSAMMIRLFKSEIPLSAAIGISLILFYLATAILGPLFAPYGQSEIVGNVWKKPAANSFSAPTISDAICCRD